MKAQATVLRQPEVLIRCECGRALQIKGELTIPCVSCGRLYAVQLQVTMREKADYLLGTPDPVWPQEVLAQ